MRASLLLVALAFVLFEPASAQALRCGTHLISTGDTRGEVQRRCGEPADVVIRVDQRSVHQQVGGALVSRTVSVLIETWTLNFGPQRFMQRIEFRDGIVQSIETLGRGYPPEQLGAYGRNVHTGESRDRVRATWGAPAEQTVRVVSDAVRASSGLVLSRNEYEVETWLFNFGPNRFMRRVVFQNGRVVRIETLGRGY